jgi:predicted RNase H-like HicB family nuclease
MTETVLVQTPLEVTFVIDRDEESAIYYGCLQEFPGIISQGRTRQSVKGKLIALLREISREHPEELRFFK